MCHTFRTANGIGSYQGGLPPDVSEAVTLASIDHEPSAGQSAPPDGETLVGFNKLTSNQISIRPDSRERRRSSYRGVMWNKNASCWRAYVRFLQPNSSFMRMRLIGFFDAEEDAARAYDEIAILHWAEPVLNFNRSDYTDTDRLYAWWSKNTTFFTGDYRQEWSAVMHHKPA